MFQTLNDLWPVLKAKTYPVMCQYECVFLSAFVFNWVFCSQCFEESQLVSLDPIKEFGNWFDQATKCPEVGEANAMCIATATK